MGLLQALVLGIVQGLTEFFPISSSAHLQIAKWFLGCENSSHFFDLVCHSGTLLALLFYLRKEVWNVLTSVRKMALFTVALAPLVPAYFLLKPLRVAASDPHYLGYCLMFTGLLLFAACRKRGVVWETGTVTETVTFTGGFGEWRDVLFIGVMQALALVPGISRSGSTIAAARFCGWEWIKAARFSFLLSIPAILGGQVLESAKLLKSPTEMEIVPLALGFAASFGTGLIAVRFVFWIYEKEKVRPLAWYCLGIGLLAIIFYGKTA